MTPDAADAGLQSFVLNGKQILIVDKTLPPVMAEPKLPVDVLILSKNPRLYISHLLDAFRLKQVVVDGSVPAWKAALWKKDCDSLKIPCYNVAEKGAFVMNW
jgi:competence protein ComEC